MYRFILLIEITLNHFSNFAVTKMGRVIRFTGSINFPNIVRGNINNKLFINFGRILRKLTFQKFRHSNGLLLGVRIRLALLKNLSAEDE